MTVTQQVLAKYRSNTPFIYQRDEWSWQPATVPFATYILFHPSYVSVVIFLITIGLAFYVGWVSDNRAIVAGVNYREAQLGWRDVQEELPLEILEQYKQHCMTHFGSPAYPIRHELLPLNAAVYKSVLPTHSVPTLYYVLAGIVGGFVSTGDLMPVVVATSALWFGVEYLRRFHTDTVGVHLIRANPALLHPSVIAEITDREVRQNKLLD